MTNATHEVAVARSAAASFIVKIKGADGSCEYVPAARVRTRYADVPILDVLEPGETVAVAYRLEPGMVAYIMTAQGDRESVGVTIEQIHGRRRGGGGSHV